MNALDAVGHTPLLRLQKVVPPGCAEVLVKLEAANPTGSLKDRMALAVISRAETDGRLRHGHTVLEYTGGSTGTSLAWVCAARGYRLRIITSDAFSLEKRNHMASLGAELTLVESEGGRTTKKLILDMIETARRLALEPHTYWTDQLNNADAIEGYRPLGEEILAVDRSTCMGHWDTSHPLIFVPTELLRSRNQGPRARSCPPGFVGQLIHSTLNV
jgi:cysteine synthase A